MFSWLYANLKYCRLLSRSIDKIKDSSQGSVKRTFNWLWTQLIEYLDELREEANEESIRDALVRPKVKGAPAPKKEGDNKPEPSVPANPAPPSKPKKEGKGSKGKEGKGKGKKEIQRIRMGSQRRQEEEKARTPKVKVRATGRHKPRKPPRSMSVFFKRDL